MRILSLGRIHARIIAFKRDTTSIVIPVSLANALINQPTTAVLLAVIGGTDARKKSHQRLALVTRIFDYGGAGLASGA